MLKKFYLALITLSSILISVIVHAAEETAKASSAFSDSSKFYAIAAAFGIAVAAFGGALGQGRVASAALEGISRNPGSSGKMFVPLILGLVFIESLVIYSLVIAFILVFK